MDLALSLMALVLLSPLLLVLAILVRVDLGSPIVFRQTRPGLRARPFELYKFRTMIVPGHDDAAILSDEQRLTRLGQFLRSTSLDELPELYNVLRGDMSFVGPRPLLAEYLPLYSTEQARRHNVRPGITGWAQVNGRNAIAWTERFRLDIWYVENQSTWLDVKILLITVAKVLGRKGVSHAGYATMPRFTGSGSRQGE